MSHTFKRTETFEIKSFPHYRKYSSFYYKILNETHEISIKYWPVGEYQSVEIGYDTIVPNNTFRDGSYEITKEEFDDIFKKATKLLNEKLGLQD